MNREEFDKQFRDRPYDHCGLCDQNEANGGHCKMANKYQRLPRDKYRGALGLCMKIGGKGC